jgi:hypothetical protein
MSRSTMLVLGFRAFGTAAMAALACERGLGLINCSPFEAAYFFLIM